jgi:DNA-binding transcriptional regulator GbsR (MarR family)
MSNNKSQLREGQAALVERLAVDQEKAGLTPAAAKVFALLMVTDVAQLTFDEIRETLGISKSAASAAINYLLTIKKIEYVTHLGDRKRYFKPRISNLHEDLPLIVDNIQSAIGIYKDILAQRPNATKEHNEGMAKLIDFLSFITKELPLLIEKYQRSKK